jgi:hypothetical protein
MASRKAARPGLKRLMVMALITLTSLPLTGAVWSLMAARSFGDALFVIEVLAPAALTFVAGNITALIIIRRSVRRPPVRPLTNRFMR